MISSIIQLGNKVDLCMVQQIEQEKKTGVRAHIYKSQVTDIFADDEIELTMPSEAGKLILLPVGIRFEFVFYSQGGLYRGIGLVKERYKTNNMYMLRVSLKSQLHKYQRREYYRMPCVINMAYYDITAQQALNIPLEQYPAFVELPEIGMNRKTGSIVDISGGGARFVTETENKNDSYIIIEVQLHSIEDTKDYFIPAHILSSAVSPTNKERFENRAEFILKDRKVREEIIRFIFDEERKNRNRELKEMTELQELQEQQEEKEKQEKREKAQGIQELTQVQEMEERSSGEV